MKSFLLLILALLSFALPGRSQSKLGDVACVYITTRDLDSSLLLYEKLGFPKTAANTFPIPWAQASDGGLLIMMRKDASPYIGLTYYTNDVDKIAAQLEKEGIVFTQKPREGDPVKRYYFKSPDGFNIMLASNLGGFQQPGGITMLNMKKEDFGSADKYPNKQCGVFGEFCHPVINLDSSISFWQKIGFELKYREANPYPHAIPTYWVIIIGLHQTKSFNYPAITYFGRNVEKRVQQLKAQGLKDFSNFMGSDNYILKTWEGQHLFLFSIGI